MILIKNYSEIDLIRESAQIVAETLQLTKSYVKAGITTLELDRIAEDYIKSNNAIPAFKGYGNDVPFPASICASINEEVVHGIPSERELEDGDIISLDIGVLKNNYYGDAALTVAVGEISEEKKLLMKVTEESLYKGIEAAVAGNRIGDISHAVQEYVESFGFSIVRDLTGHGVGRKLHEDPPIPNYGKPNSGPLIKEGMTIAIEPMVNAGVYKVRIAEDDWTIYTADRKPSAHYEHTIAIINGKPEILSVC